MEDGSRVNSVENMLLISFSNFTWWYTTDQDEYDHFWIIMTKKQEPREYAKNREEYFREFHEMIAPVVVLKVEGKDD